MRIDIAHYKRGFVLVRITALFLLYFCVSLLSFLPVGGVTIGHFLSARPLWIPMAVIGWGIGLFVFYLEVVALKRMIFDDGRALWIDDGEIIFFQRWNFSIVCRDVMEIVAGNVGKRKKLGIRFRMRDGSNRIILTGSLIEPADLIASRLRQHILSKKENGSPG